MRRSDAEIATASADLEQLLHPHSASSESYHEFRQEVIDM
jgi:hypothetical protein